MRDKSERFAIGCAVRAVAEMGCKILVGPDEGGAAHFADWVEPVRSAVIGDYRAACDACAFIVERPYCPAIDAAGWRLARLGAGPDRTGHSWGDGHVYADAESFGEAMRLVEDCVRLAREANAAHAAE
jgi:hypothetical protein